MHDSNELKTTHLKLLHIAQAVAVAVATIMFHVASWHRH